MPDALRLSGLHVSCNILNLQVFVGRIRRSRRIRRDKAHIDICLSPALQGFFRQKQGDSDEKSVIYLAKLCFIVYPCQTARHKAAECISPF
ncbi:fructose-bisphosphate aldolase [Escherichia coli]|nr:fructose-bisphosphate aldolase [Escherichia coli]